MDTSLPHRLDITVSALDIANGRHGHWSANAIGLAIKRALPGCYVEVSDYITIIQLGDETGRYSVPAAMRTFLDLPVHGLWPQPFTLYRLSVTDDRELCHNTNADKADAIYRRLSHTSEDTHE